MLWRKAYGYKQEAKRREVACAYERLTTFGWTCFFLGAILAFGAFTGFAS